MGSKSRYASAIVAILALYVASCVDPQEVADIKAKVDEVQAQQKDMIGKLAGLEAGQKKILDKGPAAAARPAKPKDDPNKVYPVKKGNSFWKGAANPTVTVVEFSDFQ